MCAPLTYGVMSYNRLTLLVISTLLLRFIPNTFWTFADNIYRLLYVKLYSFSSSTIVYILKAQLSIFTLYTTFFIIIIILVTPRLI